MNRDDIVARVTRRYEEDLASGRQAISRDDIPLTYEHITTQWLTAVLAAHVPGAEVTALRLGPRDVGTSGRRRVFCDYNEAGRRAGLPKSVFC